jgi:tryptophan halogenase
MKKSIAFFIPNDSDTIPPYTESIAMKYGWVWKIPVEGRFGCGYCFDSDFITDEEAITEIKEHFGDDVEVGNSFSYEAGRYENNWVKNCIAIGLAGGFVEPLEATSIWGVIAQLRYFTENTIGAMNRSEFIINKYNRKIAKFNDDTKDFIFLHYLTKRDDSDFWKTFRDKNKSTENIQKLLDECKETMPDNDFLVSINTHYESSSFYSIMSGLGLFDKHIATNTFNALVSDIRREEIAERKKLYFLNMLLTLKIAQEHADFIKYLR